MRNEGVTVERRNIFKEIGRRGSGDDVEKKTAGEVLPPVISVQPLQLIVFRNVLIEGLR